MNDYDFVLWLCLWPVAASLSSYLDEKRNQIRGKKFKDQSYRAEVVILFTAWVVVGAILRG